MQINYQVRNLLTKYHLRLTPDKASRLLELLQANDKIAAIKLICQESALGLRKAKDLADALGQIVRDE